MVFVGIVFAVISPSLTVLAFLPIPVIVIGSLRYQRRLQPRYDAVRAATTRIGDTLTNSLGGVATIKAFSGEQREVERLDADSDHYRQVNGDAIRLSSAFIPLIRIAILVGFTMTLVLGGRAALEGTLAVGMYSVLVFMTQRLAVAPHPARRDPRPVPARDGVVSAHLRPARARADDRGGHP